MKNQTFREGFLKTNWVVARRLERGARVSYCFMGPEFQFEKMGQVLGG
jgi:hypothetical protein